MSASARTDSELSDSGASPGGLGILQTCANLEGATGPEVIAGQLWVNAKICELAKGREPPVQAFEWEDPASAKDFAKGTIGLDIWTGADRRVIRFLESELEDAEDDMEVQSSLTARLREAPGVRMHDDLQNSEIRRTRCPNGRTEIPDEC